MYVTTSKTDFWYYTEFLLAERDISIALNVFQRWHDRRRDSSSSLYACLTATVGRFGTAEINKAGDLRCIVTGISDSCGPEPVIWSLVFAHETERWRQAIEVWRSVTRKYLSMDKATVRQGATSTPGFLDTWSRIQSTWGEKKAVLLVM